ncbi:hypothetical protein [Sediminitomix flava]|uniref:Parallel beta helix pectate lyase-like protein n=1 Tax=Sediminitomix flava TaxID=379075 RepID=A0A315Z7G4_SEDFL|nr:hypothetical protein [Sediminitomix flava]PWJ40084.1 hypothetical protein BC781_105147 [Sediminitomix flava]
MRSLNLLFIFFITIPTIFAQEIHTVSNNPNIPATFDNLQDAINQAKSGDYIYAHPSSTTYGEIEITKSIKLIGGGYFNNANQYDGLASKITEIRISPDADQTTIANCFIDNMYFEALGSSNTDFTALIIEHNYIGRIDFYPINSNFGGDLLFQNNIITNTVFNNWSSISPSAEFRFSTNILGRIANAKGSSILIKNNIFNPVLALNTTALENINGVFLANNIFYGYEERNSIGINNTTGSHFYNNLCYQTKDSFNNGDNLQTDNINDSNPLFLVQKNSFSNLSDIIASNFRLQSGSPALGTGTGSETANIGIADSSDGNAPFDPAQNYAFPRVNSVQITTPLISNDQLEITIEANYPSYTE